jgi:hypothetical protein
MWPFKSAKQVREDATGITFLCKECGTEFIAPREYGAVVHCCAKCRKVHEVWTGDPKRRDVALAGIPDGKTVLVVKRIALKVDSAGRVRVVGEIENTSERWFCRLLLCFDVREAGQTYPVVAFPELDIANQTDHKGAGRIRPKGRLEFHHWLNDLQGKIKGMGAVVENVELSGELV